MTEVNQHKTCAQCGQELPAPEIITDEETGMHLCPVCSFERESCGCSDDEKEGQDNTLLGE
jgi:DNA-directed RNA polymerase subunit RPC12/RpoP